MPENLQDIRDNAFKHVRRTIGEYIDYNDSLAGNEINQMTASQATAVLSMPETEMVSRWAPETDYDSYLESSDE